ncbi:hypothetical protein HDU97_010125 [Phlyctochytrium planicorne]|nr:hypothetical protein HDU97_010125 [Phlyctochytrium planicorne]
MSRLLHYVFEATLLTTAFSGARRAGGFELDLKKIENETARTIVSQYVYVGDYVLDTAIAQIKKYPDIFPRR